MAGLWYVCNDLLLNNKGKPDVVEWETVVNIYNPCSGETHLLNFFPYEVFQFLLLKPASLSDVAERMALLCDEENDKKWNNKILDLLKQLKEFELIDYQSQTAV